MALKRIKKRKEKRMKIFMGVFLTLLMVASGFAFFLSGQHGGGQQNANLRDSGKSFTIDHATRTYTASFNGEEQSFFFLPSTIAATPFPENAIPLVNNANALVISFNPLMNEQNLQVVDLIRFDTGSVFNTPVIGAVSAPTQRYALPTVVCENATAAVPVFFFDEAEEFSMTSDGNCVRFLGNGTDFLEMRDRLLYEYYGIFE